MDYTKKVFGISQDICEELGLDHTDINILDFLKHKCLVVDDLVFVDTETVAKAIPVVVGTRATYSRRIRKKKKAGLLSDSDNKHPLVDYIKANTNEGYSQLPYAWNTCDWCKGDVVVLEEHHYPIQAKDGGTETVSICPNCHATFHHTTAYKMNMEVIKDLKNNIK